MIRFPQVHIATSVVNRILEIAENLPQEGAGAPLSAPRVPDGAMLGAQLDAALGAPQPENLPGIEASPDPGATAQGKPLLDTLLSPPSG